MGASKSFEPVERLQLLENGEEQPTRALLVRMAKQYRRPLVAFYLSEIPKKGVHAQDFRTLPEGYARADHAYTDVLIRRVGASQSLLRAALEDEDEADELAFIGSRSLSDGVQDVATSIREKLPLTLDALRAARNAADAFSKLRRAVESIGVYVILAGNLGSYHTTIEVRVLRGFALCDPVAPLVVVNTNDTRAAWSFTLLHELAHLWLGQSGICNGATDSAVEQYCDMVAAELMLPRRELRNCELNEIDRDEDIVNTITTFAEEQTISRSMVANALYRRQQIRPDAWRRLSNRFRDAWSDGRSKQRANGSGGPGYYTVCRFRVGDALIKDVQRMMSTGALTATKAGTILGIKAVQVNNLLRVAGASRAS